MLLGSEWDSKRREIPQQNILVEFANTSITAYPDYGA